MSLPKEPRQLMINLMYLVLTAMLALNVSSEILHAFKTINQSISASNSSISDKNNKLYKEFDDNESMEGQRDRVKPFNDKAKEVKAAAAAIVKYIDEWKERVIIESGGYEDGEIKRLDNIDASTLLLVERRGGDTLRSKLTAFRELVASKVDPKYKDAISKQLPINISNPEKTDNNPQGDWATAYFHNMPTMAVVTLLSKFQNDVRNSEAIVVNQLFTEAANRQVKFDAFQAIAVPKTSYALVGQKVEAQIMLAAYNKAVNPQVTNSAGNITKVESGIAYWETTAGGIGLQTVRGQVTIDMGGQPITQPYEFQYMVGSTGASMQLDKMNVFYIGVDNPITVSAAGYSLEDVSIAVPGATITPGATRGQYTIRVTTPGKVMADINAKTATGMKRVGGLEVRVKFIPDPVAKIANKTGGGMQTNIFKQQLGVLAVLDGFDFEARFKVTAFDFSVLPKRGDLIGPYHVSNALFSSSKEVEAARNRLKPGDKVFIEEIRGVGPDGRSRALNTINLTML